jgi:hypothetical protein
MPTENGEGQLPKTHSKAIGKYILVKHGNEAVPLDRVHCIQGSDAPEVFALEKIPCAWKRSKLNTRQRRSGVRNSLQSRKGLINRCKGYVKCVYGLHDLWRRALRLRSRVVVPLMMHRERKAS